MAGVSPSDNDRLEAIRAYADGAMRYYATAFLRETDENRELMRAYMGITANILALLDRDTLDDRSMMSGREQIIQQYIEQARSDPYEPGNCSFCGARPVAAWFEAPTFRTFVRSSADVRAEGAWLACAVCLALVEANDHEGLVGEASSDSVGVIERRGVRGVGWKRRGCSKRRETSRRRSSGGRARADDRLTGGPGDDVLDGGRGHDTFVRGRGEDVVIVDSFFRDAEQIGKGCEVLIIGSLAGAKGPAPHGGPVVRIGSRRSRRPIQAGLQRRKDDLAGLVGKVIAVSGEQRIGQQPIQIDLGAEGLHDDGTV